MEPGIQGSVILAGEYHPFLMYAGENTPVLYIRTAWYRSGATPPSEKKLFYGVAA
jgi:hypothetical protein